MTAAIRGRGSWQGIPTEQFREYRYRALFHLTHDQYLDEPAVTVDWLLGIEGAVRRAEQEEGSTRAGRPDADGVVTVPL